MSISTKSNILDIVAFTARGAVLAGKLLELYPDSCAAVPIKYSHESLQPLDNLHEWTRSHFKTGRTLVFIGAVGIAVRAIAPFVKDKTSDAAVICIDEDGEHIIPVLSGHIGGANRVAIKLAEALGGHAVITTATDRHGIIAFDEWSRRNNCVIANPSEIKHISAALLDGEEVGLRCDFPINGDLPPGVSDNEKANYGVEIAIHSIEPYPHTLHIIPRIIVAGIGCRKGVPTGVLEERLNNTLANAQIPTAAIGTIATIDIKSEEPGLLELCKKINAEFLTYSAGQLNSMQGNFEKSDRVQKVTGVDNVCQRAVACTGAKPLTGKTASNGVTIALGILDWTPDFLQPPQEKQI